MRSKRQYIHQLGKWGIFKNQKQLDTANDIPNGLPHLNTVKGGAQGHMDLDELQNNIDKSQSGTIHPQPEPSPVLISGAKIISDDAKSIVSHISFSTTSTTRNYRKYAEHVKEIVEKGANEEENRDVGTIFSEARQALFFSDLKSPWNPIFEHTECGIGCCHWPAEHRQNLAMAISSAMLSHECYLDKN